MTRGRATIALCGEMNIYRAAELKEQLSTALTSHPAGLDLDLSAVSEIDSSGVQLLMAAKREAQTAGQPFALTAHSAAVVDVIELLDLAAAFGDSLVVPA